MPVRPLHWTDTREIALALAEAHPEVDPRTLRFTDLHRWVCALPGFADDPKHSGEKILEAIQADWIEESDA
jgi:FeS assembly protein IscX